MTTARVLALGPLALVLWRPVSGGDLLYPMLAAMAALSLMAWQPVPDWLARAAFFLLLAVTSMMFVGSIRNTPGLVPQAIQWLGAPAVWFAWACSFDLRHIRRILLVIVTVTAVLSGLLVLYVLNQTGVVRLPVPDAVLQAQEAGFTQDSTGTAVRFYGLSTLAGAGPLCAAAAVAPHSPLMPPRALSVVAATLAGWAAFAGGRQAIIVVIVVSPLALLAVRWLSTHRRRGPLRLPASTILLGTPLIILIAALVGTSNAGPRILSALQDGVYVYAGVGQGSAGRGADNLARTAQAAQLAAGWGEHPLWGSGLGATLDTGYVRSRDAPWMFELQYHQLLFDGGFAAVLCVAAALWFAGRGVLEAARMSPEHGPVVAVATVAAISMLVVNASNPYLQAVGHWWPIGLAIGVAAAVSRGGHPRGGRGARGLPVADDASARFSAGGRPASRGL